VALHNLGAAAKYWAEKTRTTGMPDAAIQRCENWDWWPAFFLCPIVFMCPMEGTWWQPRTEHSEQQPQQVAPTLEKEKEQEQKPSKSEDAQKLQCKRTPE
jgi:hypothetical protein